MPEITPKIIQEIENSFFAIMTGIRDISLPGPEHHLLVEGINEVAAEIGIKPPALLFHKGGIAGNAYDPILDTMYVSDKSLDVLTPQEFRAYMAHEFDHIKKADKICRNKTRMDRLRERLEANPEDEALARRAVWYVGRSSDFFEFAADDRAARTYGADVWCSALQKNYAAFAETNLAIRMRMFPDVSPELVKDTDAARIRQRVYEIACGTFHVSDESLSEMPRRFQRLKEMHGARVLEPAMVYSEHSKGIIDYGSRKGWRERAPQNPVMQKNSTER